MKNFEFTRSDGSKYMLTEGEMFSINFDDEQCCEALLGSRACVIVANDLKDPEYTQEFGVFTTKGSSRLEYYCPIDMLYEKFTNKISVQPLQ